MAEVGRNAYATTSGNAAAGAPNVVAVVNDGTGDRQIMVLGDPTTAANLAAVDASGNTSTKLTDGTNTAHILKSDGTAAGQNSQLTASGYLSVAFTTTTAQAVGSTDAANYRWVSVQINTQGTSSTVNFQVSNDNTNWIAANLLNQGSGTATATTSTTSAAIIYAGPLLGRYFRLNVTGISAGTTAGQIVFSAMPGANVAMGVSAAQNGTWTVQPGNTANTTAWKVDGSAVTQPVSLATNTPTLAAGSAIVGKVGIDQTTVGTTNAVSLAQLGTGTIATGNGTASTGTLRVAIASDQTTNTNALLFKETGQTTGGLTTSTLISAATTNATSVKASAGTLYGVYAYNNGASACYLKLFNLATAPTVGTSVAVMTIMLPAGGGSNIPIPSQGLAFGTGIAFSITGVGSTADTTAVAATQVFVNLAYA